MNFLKNNKGKISAVCVVLISLSVAYFSGGSGKNDILTDKPPETFEVYEEKAPEISQDAEIEKQEEQEAVQEKEEETQKEPVEVENEDKNELFCTLSVRCDTILSDISRLDTEKISIIPKDGVIFAEKKVAFSEGESVFDLLLREMKSNKIHLEFVNTPVYGSVYIEGIGNIYEFDAGELSGWMYRVNGEFPNFGCSKYYLKQGDKVEFVYTCDLGKDVGGEYVKRQGADDE